ncbi:hypothetical protein [Halobacillus sp. Nhm2S1]|uniref:hypothetical protein n=1 Tax=Halobacillus sp. Nhm2S1 TaxID=2866716 RepID=UPI001C72FC68|nr:hypothetical protein [Halobacillus sp. Nhm2S1]MBX0358596.1 hypothetical protein [Halobacillus sp. Nhm2S1]
MSKVIFMLFSALLFSNTMAHASGPFVISEEGAAGYYYQVTKEENTFTWLIGGKDDLMTVIETEENEGRLHSFRTGVENANSQLSILWITGVFFVVGSTLTLYSFNKERRMIKEALPVIIAALCIPIYILFTASIDLGHALHETEYYFQSLLK